MNIRAFIRENIRLYLTEAVGFHPIDKEEFKDKLLDLTTLDLEDDQVRIPEFDENTDSYVFSAGKIYVHVRRRNDIPSSGPFELFVLDHNDNPVGFLRGNTGENYISFNLVYINPENRGEGIATDIYEHFLNSGLAVKSDSEITDGTYGLYTRLLAYGYKPLIFDDGTVGLKK